MPQAMVNHGHFISIKIGYYFCTPAAAKGVDYPTFSSSCGPTLWVAHMGDSGARLGLGVWANNLHIGPQNIAIDSPLLGP